MFEEQESVTHFKKQWTPIFFCAFQFAKHSPKHLGTNPKGDGQTIEGFWCCFFACSTGVSMVERDITHQQF